MSIVGKVGNYLILPGLLGLGFYLDSHDYMGKRARGLENAVPSSLRGLSSRLALGSKVRHFYVSRPPHPRTLVHFNAGQEQSVCSTDSLGALAYA